MLGNAFGWPHLLLILAVILLLFGAAKLPALARSIGQSTRIFRGEMKAMKDDGKTVDSADVSSVDKVTPSRQAPTASSSNTDPTP